MSLSILTQTLCGCTLQEVVYGDTNDHPFAAGVNSEPSDFLQKNLSPL